MIAISNKIYKENAELPKSYAQSIIDTAIEKGIMYYENTDEGKSLGELKFTKYGLELYLETTNTFVRIDGILPYQETVVYQACLLRASNDNAIILNGKQTHLVIYYNNILKQSIAIGYFTSEKTDHPIANIQKLSGNMDKEQYFQLFSTPFKIENIDKDRMSSTLEENLNSYLQDMKIIKNLDKARKDMKHTFAMSFYDNNITTTTLSNVLEQHQKNTEVLPLKMKTANENFEKLNSNEKANIEKKINNKIKAKIHEYRQKGGTDINYHLSKKEEDMIKYESIVNYFKDKENKNFNQKNK